MDFALLAATGDVEVCKGEVETEDPVHRVLQATPHHHILFEVLVVASEGSHLIQIIIDPLDILEIRVLLAELARPSSNAIGVTQTNG